MRTICSMMVFHGCDVTKLPRTYVRVKLRRMRAALDELQGEIEMVSDNVESVHWGLVNKGGFSIFNDLYAAQRQSQYGTERTNLLASRAMGMLRYLNTVRQQNRGVFAGGMQTWAWWKVKKAEVMPLILKLHWFQFQNVLIEWLPEPRGLGGLWVSKRLWCKCWTLSLSMQTNLCLTQARFDCSSVWWSAWSYGWEAWRLHTDDSNLLQEMACECFSTMPTLWSNSRGMVATPRQHDAALVQSKVTCRGIVASPRFQNATDSKMCAWKEMCRGGEMWQSDFKLALPRRSPKLLCQCSQLLTGL